MARVVTDNSQKKTIERGTSTRGFASFPTNEKSPTLVQFMEWLRGVEGKKRDPETAKQITVDMSKALRSVY